MGSLLCVERTPIKTIFWENNRKFCYDYDYLSNNASRREKSSVRRNSRTDIFIPYILAIIFDSSNLQLMKFSARSWVTEVLFHASDVFAMVLMTMIVMPRVETKAQHHLLIFALLLLRRFEQQQNRVQNLCKMGLSENYHTFVFRLLSKSFRHLQKRR